VLSGAELDDCRALIAELADWACERIATDRLHPEEVGTKTSAADWVTGTDLAVERHVRERVLERFPTHRVVGEEYGASGDEHSSVAWFVDPVDGTTNFVHGLPWSSFSLVVVDEAGAAAGAVADPYRREVVWAVRGGGAFVDAEPARCAAAETLTGGIVLTELVMQSLGNGQLDLIAALAEQACVTRILGSNALSLASAAVGRASAAVLFAYNLVDCQAGLLIAREAGARILAPAGGPVPGKPFACAAPGVAEALAELLAGLDANVCTAP
jgi:fructose-1,6-bisphosphatase/inositol monophosphatase family enzyme